MHHVDNAPTSHTRKHIAPTIYRWERCIAGQTYTERFHHAGHC